MLIGVDIGGTKCAVTLGTEEGDIVKKIRFETTTVEETIEKIVSAAKELAQGEAVAACGVSCGGPLDEAKGLILSPPNLLGWDRIAICEILEKALGVPCALKNDANACAMAEWYFGAGKGTQNMVFLTFGTGLGAGIIASGKLISGANGFAGELGHIRLAEFGPAGYGKCGSFEGFCSGSGLAELGRAFAREAAQQGVSLDWAHDMEAIKPAEMAEAARNGESFAKKAFSLCGRMLGRGLAIVMDLLNPECIVLGSVYVRCRDLLEPPMYAVLEEEALMQTRAVCRIVPAALGETIGDIAALAVAKEAVQ